VNIEINRKCVNKIYFMVMLLSLSTGMAAKLRLLLNGYLKF